MTVAGGWWLCRVRAFGCAMADAAACVVWCGVVAPNRYPQLMHAAAVAALGAPDFPGASSWTDGAKSTFVNLLVAAPGVEAGKRAPGVTPIAAANAEAWFVEVVKDFAMISRGRAPCDTLYRHTRPSAS